jgi:hypothetical protein
MRVAKGICRIGRIGPIGAGPAEWNGETSFAQLVLECLDSFPERAPNGSLHELALSGRDHKTDGVWNKSKSKSASKSKSGPVVVGRRPGYPL